MPVKKDIRAQVDHLALNTEEDYFDAPVSSSRSTPTTPRGLKPSPKQVVLLPCDRLVEFEDKHFLEVTGRPQPFREYGKDDMESMIASVAEHGVLEPITVRPFGDGLYQIISGRHRTRASIANGLNDVPGIIRDDIDEIEAAFIMLDTNLEQRHNLIYSEKAWAYRMERDLRKQQGKRTDLGRGTTGGTVKIDTLAEVGKKNKESRSTVSNLIRLTYLIPQLLEMVDQETLGMKVALKLAKLKASTQQYLYEHILPKYGCIKIGQAAKLVANEEEGMDSQEEILEIFKEPAVSADGGKPFRISRTKLRGYADLASTDSEFEALILTLLEQYRNERKLMFTQP